VKTKKRKRIAESTFEARHYICSNTSSSANSQKPTINLASNLTAGFPH